MEIKICWIENEWELKWAGLKINGNKVVWEWVGIKIGGIGNG